ncbi:Smg-4/UPF3 family-domain-containing protein [Clohesyomyces aquaticus]|uniref:Smg-4/UPF3 family-domain-containing protein n=1 Tax=Clohesyomyces aquaticus TaxID=1231657 RepID=A0A1Y1ZZ80_9PLEO|nr:Smg-4/UPF3 family-domain-containing protein [Clohesyomyces aquaticus]
MGPPNGVNGVLPVSVLQKNAPASAPRGPKAASPRLKLVLRRLPPGLTKPEFDHILGDEWKLGAGKVDLLVYKKGKISRDAAKPSKPSRAYFHVTAQTHVLTLGDHVRQVSWNDAAKSFQDPALVGPPVLEYSPYHRIPAGRKRNDARQGLIDQDQEFKDFLESLTNPVTKPPAAEGDGHKEEKVKTTPLIEALREKKANKDKPSKTPAKHGRGEPKEDSADKKILAKAGKETPSASGDKNRRLSKAEKAAKEAVKVLNKEASSSKDSISSSTDKAAPTTPSPAPERKRGNASIAKSMLQRDLGLGPGPNRRRGTKREVTPAVQDSAPRSEETVAGKQKAKEAPPPAAPVAPAAAEKSTPTSAKKETPRPTRAERRAYKASLADKTNSNKTPVEDSKAQTKAAPPTAPVILKKPQTTQTPTTPKGPAASRAPPTEPASSRAQASQAPTTAGTNAPRPQAPTTSQPTSASPAPAPSARQGFLKHANASQGITEPLIEEALKVFGTVEKVEIDKRKGFAYVDFAKPEGLQKAIAASPIKVAQGAVQVLERKEKVVRRPPHPGPPAHHGPPTGPARGGRGGFPARGRGRGGARGGGHASAAPSAGVGDTAAAPPPPPAASAAPPPTPAAASEAAT